MELVTYLAADFNEALSGLCGDFLSAFDATVKVLFSILGRLLFIERLISSLMS